MGTADKVKVLKGLVAGYAEGTVSESESFDDNLKHHKNVFGNPCSIWRREKDNIVLKSHDEARNWTPYYSAEWKLMVVNMFNFLRNVESLANRFEMLKDEIFSRSTLDDIIGILLQESTMTSS